MKAARAELDSYAVMNTQGFPNPHYLHIHCINDKENGTLDLYVPPFGIFLLECIILLCSAHKLFVLQDIFRFSLFMDLLPSTL